jgi:hypothetical protein
MCQAPSHIDTPVFSVADGATFLALMVTLDASTVLKIVSSAGGTAAAAMAVVSLFVVGALSPPHPPERGSKSAATRSRFAIAARACTSLLYCDCAVTSVPVHRYFSLNKQARRQQLARRSDLAERQGRASSNEDGWPRITQIQLRVVLLSQRRLTTL